MSVNSSKIVGEGLTYDDVLLIPSYSEILPRQVEIKTQFTRGISLNAPVVAAATAAATWGATAVPGTGAFPDATAQTMV